MNDKAQETIKAVVKELLFTYPSHEIPNADAAQLLKNVPDMFEAKVKESRRGGI